MICLGVKNYLLDYFYCFPFESFVNHHTVLENAYFDQPIRNSRHIMLQGRQVFNDIGLVPFDNN